MTCWWPSATASCLGRPGRRRADFRVAKQKTGEDIIAWHTRCRSLFHHAYPTGCITTSLELKQRFCEGLTTASACGRILEDPDHESWTYERYLEVASSHLAAKRVMQSMGSGPNTSINALAARGTQASPALKPPGDRYMVYLHTPRASWLSKHSESAGTKGSSCLFCGLRGHTWADCAGVAHLRNMGLQIPAKAPSQAFSGSTAQTQKQDSRPPGNQPRQSRDRQQGRNQRPSKPGVHALGDDSEQERTEAEN